jgi:hypothetical protein
MTNNTQNPVTVNGAGADSQNRSVRKTEVLILHDSSITGGYTGILEIQDISLLPLYVERAFGIYCQIYCEDEQTDYDFLDKRILNIISNLSQNQEKVDSNRSYYTVFEERQLVFQIESIYTIKGKMFGDLEKFRFLF